MSVQKPVLDAANRIASRRKDWSFGVKEIVSALPHLNKSTVQTHIVSRCCVNAPKNHPHKWNYFRRIGRGRYQVEPEYRMRPEKTERKAANASGDLAGPNGAEALRKTLHAVIQRDEGAFVVECLELPIVSQGKDLDDAVANFREAVALHLEGEDLGAMGLAARPDLQILYEVPAA